MLSSNKHKIIEALSSIVGAMIKKRNSLGLSQQELTAMCGIHQSSFARIEAYKSTPNPVTLLKLFRPLGLSLTVTNVRE